MADRPGYVDVEKSLHSSAVLTLPKIPPATAYPAKSQLNRPPPPSRQPSSDGSSIFELMDEKEIERLGRVRPEAFSSKWAEIGFVLSVCMAQLLVEYFVSGFNVLVPTVVDALRIPPTSSTWPASSFSLVISCFLLPMGRLADMHGGKRLYIIGVGWMVIMSIVAGVARHELVLDLARAFQGLGPAAFLPSSVMLLGGVYRPGPRKNLVFSLYGACAPLGFFLGIFFAGLSAQLLSWRWYFFIGAIFTAVTFLLAVFTMPSANSGCTDKKTHELQGPTKMDWPGAVLIVSGLILIIYALTDSANTENGWGTPRIPICFALGALVVSVAGWWECVCAEQPLLPSELFKVKGFKAVVGSMFMQYGGLGILLLYSTFYMDKIMGGTPLQLVAWFTPMCVGGIIIAIFGGFVLHLVSGTILMLVAGVSWVIAPLLFAVAPEGANYWAFCFPAMVTGTIGIDISFNISNIFITTGLPRRQQGLAGAIINSNMHLSIAFFLGLADVVFHQTKNIKDITLLLQYRYVFWLEVGLAAIALVIMLAFVRLDRAKSEMTADEKLLLKQTELRCSGLVQQGLSTESIP